ncbi:MAG: hypothetical protein ACXWHB_13965 [Usitatibacter sp.]
MIRTWCAALAIAVVPTSTFAGDQSVLDACIASWGKSAPFKKGKPADSVVGTGVKVFGLGSSQSGNDAPTDKPVLVYVRPAVNVMGKSTIRLSNPKGWYCLRSAVTVAGKIDIQAHCNAHLASAREDGTSVGAADDSGKGVAVFGALRVTRFGCAPGKS